MTNLRVQCLTNAFKSVQNAPSRRGMPRCMPAPQKRLAGPVF